MSTSPDNNKEDIFQIAAKAQKLLQEILSSNKQANKQETLHHETIIKQEPVVRQQHPQQQQTQYINNQNQQFYLQQQQQQQPQPQTPNYYQAIDNTMYSSNLPRQFISIQQQQQPIITSPTQQNLIINPTFFMQHPPPIIPTLSNSATIVQQPYFYTQQQPRPSYYQAYNSTYHHNQPPQIIQMQQQHHHYYSQPTTLLNTSIPPPQPLNLNSTNTNAYYRKRKFGELNNFENNTNINNSRFKTTYQSKPTTYYNTGANMVTQSMPSSKSSSSTNDLDTFNDLTGQILHDVEEEDLNIMRERELKELKCKSVVEKMSVFLKYYQQFKQAYHQRVQTLECSDSLKLQFHSLIKYLNEYENLLAELNMMITEHERDHCKNNHRKTKKFFNKTKAFIRYECNKRLQSNIFEYRRLINSQDRYAGMYDLLDMNSYLISLLPDIGVSIRRYINRCEKEREQEQLEDEDEYQQQAWYSEENSTDSNELNGKKNTIDSNDLTIPTFKEYVALNRGDEDDEDVDVDVDDDDDDDEDEEEDYEVDDEDDDNLDDTTKENKKKKRKSSLNESNATTSSQKNNQKNPNRVYESFSKGIDLLNRYLLKRVEEEETLDELVKERIVKWINKRQAKYILIFSEVDKLLNQHKAGECYSKFHSYLLFNLGKLVTVCDSYHQKLKELLYSTTIRRKKKRKKVKLLPESMADVFNEIIDLKKALELTKISIKRCNLLTNSLGNQSVSSKSTI